MRELEIKQRELITEGWNDSRLSLLETKHIVPFVTSIERYVAEAKLTPDQIQQLFTGAEQGMTAGGKNRTLVGKGVDAAKLPIEAVKFIDKKINELGKALQNSGPVKNIDAKFDQLKAKIGEKDSKVVNGIKAVSDWAKANPGKASIAVAILTTAAAMAGGPMGGAIAGFLARATKDLLQGEKLSTAVGKSIKTAAYGAIAGWALRGIGEWLEGLRINAIDYPTVPGLKQVNVGFKHTFEMPGFSSTKDLGSMIVPADKYDEFMNIVNELQQATANGATSSPAAVDSFYKLWNFAETFDIKQALQDIELNNAALRAITQENDAFLQSITAAKNAIASLAQGSISGKLDSNDVKVKGKPVAPAEPADDNPNIVRSNTESKQFTQAQIETLIEWCDNTPEVLTEGPLDALKKGAAAVGGAIKKGAAAVAKAGKNLTTKVTADKLNKAWVSAGSPDDSDKIADILRKAGVSDDVLAPMYKQFGATLPPAPEPAAEPAAQSGATPTPTDGKEPAAAGGTGTAPAQGGNAPAGQSSPPAQGGAAPAQGSGQPAAAAGPMDFKGIQQAVAKLNPAQAKELVAHIDSLNKNTAAPAATGQPAAQSSTKPAAGAAPATGSAKAAPAADKNAAAGDTYEKAKADIRSVQGGAKPIPPKTAADIEASIAKMGKGDKENGVYAAQKIMQLAKLGVDVKDVQAKWLANSKAGERFLTQSQYFEISKMLREHGLRWSDLGLRIHLVEGTNAYFGISLV